jgi:ceramide glucosyltransferase
MLYYVLATLSGLMFARRAATPVPLPDNAPQVALLKPLHGTDGALAENLESFLNLNYPHKEYVFGVTTLNDPAVAAVEEVRRRHPEARITQTVGDEPSTNRKVGKLLRMLRNPPSSEILVMSDADVLVKSDYLRRVVGELCGPRVGMVTCLYGGVAPERSLGAKLEALYINTDFTPAAIVSHYVEPMRHAFASTIAIRQSTLQEVGGLGSVKNAFGDDFALARRVAAAGYGIRLSSSIVTMVTDRISLPEFWDRQMRWARVDRKIRPTSLARLGINGPFWALTLMLASGFTGVSVAAAALALGARVVMTASMLRAVLRLPLRLSDLALTPIKDLVMQAVWIGSLFGNKVEWRGRKLRLLPTGEMKELGP